MSQTTDELRAELKKSLDVLATVRDEIRVKVHLAGMEAKDQWNELEKELTHAQETATKAASAVTKTALDETLKKLHAFRDSLG
jgi:D-ribose pyranose/furanose isomerase RbsD